MSHEEFYLRVLAISQYDGRKNCQKCKDINDLLERFLQDESRQLWE